MTFPIVRGQSEAVFGIEDIACTDSGMVVTARNRPWAEGLEGESPAGTLGVLADNASGYAIISGAPEGHWSVSTELTLDLVGPVPTDGRGLIATAALLQHSGTAGYSAGTIADSCGRTLAYVRQRGMYVPGHPSPPESPVADTPPESAVPSLAFLFGQEVGSKDIVADLNVLVTEDMVNPLGNLHGGIALCLAEWMAIRALDGTGQPGRRTTSIHVVYLRPAPLGARLRVHVTVEHRGRRLGLAHVKVVTAEGRSVITATVTTEAA